MKWRYVLEICSAFSRHLVSSGRNVCRLPKGVHHCEKRCWPRRHFDPVTGVRSARACIAARGTEQCRLTGSWKHSSCFSLFPQSSCFSPLSEKRAVEADVCESCRKQSGMRNSIFRLPCLLVTSAFALLHAIAIRNKTCATAGGY